MTVFAEFITPWKSPEMEGIGQRYHAVCSPSSDSDLPAGGDGVKVRDNWRSLFSSHGQTEEGRKFKSLKHTTPLT